MKGISEGKPVGKYAWIDCECGSHLVDLFGIEWNDKKTGAYKCNTCERPLVIRGDDGHFYLVGDRI